MAKRAIKAGSTDQTIDVFIPSSASTTGAGLTGLVYNSAGLTCYYRKGATGSATALTLATQTVGGAHSDGGFVEVDATNMPGVYRLDLSDTIVASAGMVTLLLKGATNMAPVPVELEVVAYDPFDSVRLGLTALPNAAAEAAGGLFTRGTGAGQINQDANGRINVNVRAWLDTACATPTVAGVPEVDPTHVRGTAISSAAVAGFFPCDLFYLNSQADPVDIAGGFFGGYGTIGDIFMNSLSWSGAMTAIDMTKINSIPAAIRANTAQAGASGTITLDASASAVNDFYNGALIYLTGGTGAGQYAIITDYVGATKVASILPSWRTTPDNTTAFAIYPNGMVDLQSVGLTRGYEPSVPGAVLANLYYINDFGDGVPGLAILGDDYYTDGVVDVNLTQVGGNPLAATTAGYVPADVRYIVGALVNTGTAQLGVNVVSAGGTTWASGSITSGVVAANAATEIAQAVLTEAASAPIASDVKKINSVTVDGAGTAADPWGPV